MVGIAAQSTAAPTRAPHVVFKHGHSGARQPKWAAAALTVEHAMRATEKAIQATQQGKAFNS